MESRTAETIVLHWRPHGESDKIVTVLTRDHGKLTGIAKGARNSRRRFVNSLEPLARVRLHFRTRPNASLAFFESAELLHPLIVEPTRFAYASYLGELTEQLTGEGHPVAEVYDLLEEALAALDSGPASSAFLRAFELRLLTRTGYDPQLARCAGCGQTLDATPAIHVEPARGNWRCSACRTADAIGFEAPGAAARELLALRDLPLADCQARPLGPTAGAIARITGRLLEVHLQRPLRSLKLIAQLTGDQAGNDGGKR